MQVIAAAVLVLVGAVLCGAAIADGRTFAAVVGAVQCAIGVYLLVWHVRERRRLR
ncbi:hypothetical protein [Cellulomonas hominis]|uniref:hypothetical protein n=1 Tax=Cellulomonas hominis TaxID=156981 RepID=UPI001BA17847|nr:hypothetical protein [Cellulomonas hominis]VTR78421.1 hypothetical protein CHMI_03202 [Cellulomonas hominis]